MVEIANCKHGRVELGSTEKQIRRAGLELGTSVDESPITLLVYSVPDVSRV